MTIDGSMLYCSPFEKRGIGVESKRIALKRSINSQKVIKLLYLFKKEDMTFPSQMLNHAINKFTAN